MFVYHSSNQITQNVTELAPSRKQGLSKQKELVSNFSYPQLPPLNYFSFNCSTATTSPIQKPLLKCIQARNMSIHQLKIQIPYCNSHWFRNRSLMSSQCVESKMAREVQPSGSRMFLLHFDLICVQLMNKLMESIFFQ